MPLDGSGDVRLLATGADFFAHPRVSPDGSRLAYVAWDHPNMPWDATELRVAAVAAGSPTERGSHRLVAGGEAADSSVLQPAWHPQSGALYYVDDSSGYYNLRRLAAANVDSGAAEPRAARPTDFGGGSPGWSLGQQGYTFLADGRVAATVKDGATGESRLLTFADSDGDEAVTESGPADGLPHSFGGLCAAADGTIYMLGGSPAEPAAVYSWQFGGKATKLASSSSASVEADFVSTPTPVEFPCPLGTSHGYYYPPTSGDSYSSEAAPPLLVKAHGGPTGATSAGFNPGIQFWTSRGFAVLDVDYGGSPATARSTGGGCAARGGSSTLTTCAPAPSIWSRRDWPTRSASPSTAGRRAGTRRWARSPSATSSRRGARCTASPTWARWRRTRTSLRAAIWMGSWGSGSRTRAIYDARAPINAVDKLSCPILLLQGDEDKIVPPNQAELMHAALLKKGLPCALKIYEGEQHGFRQAANIEDALESELYFYAKVFGFEPADELAGFAIDNLA